MDIYGNRSAFPVRTLNVPQSMITQDAATAGGMAFLVGELEKRDPKLHEPLTSTTWPRDIVAKTGGGWVDYTSTINVSYGTTGGNEDGIIGGQTNNIPVMQADIDKDQGKVFTWANILKVPFIDQQKLQGIGRSLDELLDKGIHLNGDKTLDTNVYTGFPVYGTYGLVNSPRIVVSLVPAGAKGSRLWSSKDPEELLSDVNRVQQETWEASGFDLSGMANHILIPPEHFSMLATRMVSVADTRGAISLLTYLTENNLGATQGRQLYIAPCIQCRGAGEGGTDRMVGYANDEDRVRFDITVPMQRFMTQTSVAELAYLTAYGMQFGQVVWVYESHAKYYDGI